MLLIRLIQNRYKTKLFYFVSAATIILKRLENIWNKHPDLRLGQLFINLYHLMEQQGVNMFSIEDDELLHKLEKMYRDEI